MTRKAAAFLPVLLTSLLGWGQPCVAQAPPDTTPEPSEMSVQVRRVRHAYMKLMRYHSAAVDERAAEKRRAADPDGYVSFGITVLRSGPIEDVLGEPLAHFVSPRSERVLELTRRSRQEKHSVKHVAYKLRWKTLGKKKQHGTVSRDCGSCDGRLTGYVAYVVTIQLEGKQRVYKALALHTRVSSQGELACLTLFDGVAKGIEGVLKEQHPAIRSPWKAYIRSPLYKAIVADVRRGSSAAFDPEAKHNQPPDPVARAIGFLPGDDAAEAFGAAGLDSAFEPELFAAGGCCINNPPRSQENGPPVLFGQECRVSAGERGALTKAQNWIVRWPDNQQDLIAAEGRGDCGIHFLCRGGDPNPTRDGPFYCWPQFFSPEITLDGTTLRWSQTIREGSIQFETLRCNEDGLEIESAAFSGHLDRPSVCRVTRVFDVDNLSHECRACCGGL